MKSSLSTRARYKELLEIQIELKSYSIYKSHLRPYRPPSTTRALKDRRGRENMSAHYEHELNGTLLSLTDVSISNNDENPNSSVSSTIPSQEAEEKTHYRDILALFYDVIICQQNDL